MSSSVEVSSVLVEIPVWTEEIDQFLCEIGKLATGIFVSFFVFYGDVLQNLLFASSTNNSKTLSHYNMRIP